jgi:hypothetical protein
VVSAGGHRKGKYAPLRALTSRLGARKLLQLQPGLIRDMVRESLFDLTCAAAPPHLHGRNCKT